MKKALVKLINVKTIITLMILIVFVVQVLKGEISPEYVMTTVTTVIAFYFGTQLEKQKTKAEAADTAAPQEEE